MTAAAEGRRPISVGRMVLDRVAATPQQEAFRYPVSAPDGETWQSLTWGQIGERVQAIAAGLLSLGLRPEDRVAIISETRVEWVLADLGIMCAGGATTTVYPATQPDDVAYILADSGTRFVFAEDYVQRAKLRRLRDRLPDLRTVVTFDDSPGDAPDPGEAPDPGDAPDPGKAPDPAEAPDDAERDAEIGLAELERRGRERLAADPAAVHDAVAAVGRESLATLIYTSGTTGRPKGVRLVHDNWTYEGMAIDELGLLRPDDVQYLWLPLSHSYGKVLLAGQLAVGFASAVDGRVDKIVDNLGVVRPTFMAAAPRVFEKVYARVEGLAAEEGGPKLRIFRWAVGVGRRVSRLRQQGRRPGVLLAAQHAVADRLVFSKIRARFGGRLRYFVSGSAPLSVEVAEWFHGTGMLILEGYGLTETSAGTFVNRPAQARFGTVGQPLPGVEVRIAEDGEVLLRGPGNIRGYHGLPEQTAEMLDPDGWLHTGDIGELDEAGFLRITDRKKDLIKTSGGKYVAPQPIEVQFAAICPLASHFMVHGDGRNYCTALVALDPDELAAWARGHGVAETDYATLATRDDIRATVAAAVEKLNSRLNRWETIKDFRVLDHDLTVEAGELTPSLKVRRRVVESRYRPLLDEMYATPAPTRG
jgi:long-chain acyl-CoA synthetase